MIAVDSIKSQVTEEIELAKKALSWIKNKALNNTPVRIGQLASSLKVTKVRAEKIAKTLVMSYVDDAMGYGQDFKIFIEEGQAPSWMRDFAPPRYVTAALQEARRKTTSLLERCIHRNALYDKYGTEFATVLKNRYRANEELVLNVIQLFSIDTTSNPIGDLSHLDHLAQINWPDQGLYYGSNRWSGYNQHFDNGTKVMHAFGNVKFELVPELDALDNHVELEFAPNKRYPQEDELTAKYKIILEGLINLMQLNGMCFVGCGPIFNTDSRDLHMTIQFVSKHDVADTIKFHFPWDNVVFRVKH